MVLNITRIVRKIMRNRNTNVNLSLPVYIGLKLQSILYETIVIVDNNNKIIKGKIKHTSNIQLNTGTESWYRDIEESSKTEHDYIKINITEVTNFRKSTNRDRELTNLASVKK